ncbi:Hypothetical predicted protein [Octopus vulgaris]|uniref:Uncharacterized protein n=1 Tax=Octopus vulgaris TaxID=6645 RepID=A0AA36BNG5_OCTVU|nr:Hypothetical predicted protein [Octopus vulgaris]
MKFYLAILFVAACQAFSITSMVEKEAFDLLIKEATQELEQLAVTEIQSTLTTDGIDITPSELSLIQKLAAKFGEALREEVTTVISHVHSLADLKTKFAQKVYENLRVSAQKIADGIEKGPEVTKKFIHELMADIDAMEKSGHFITDIEQMFESIFEKALATVSYDVHQKRDLIDIFDKINDTLRRIVGHLHGKFHDLHDFLHQAISNGKDKLKPHIENIKTLAKTFIAHINDVNARVAQQALEFFKPWAALLGSTWTTLVNDIHKRLEQLKPTSAPIF